MKYLLEFEAFLDESNRYIDPKITIDERARGYLKNIVTALDMITKIMHRGDISGLIDGINDLSELELLGKNREWIKEFNKLQVFFYEFYAALYRTYSTSVNGLNMINKDLEDLINVNNEPLKNVRIIGGEYLHKSMIMYDPHIKKLKENLYNSWVFITKEFPMSLSDMRIIMNELGIFNGEIGEQLRPPKIIKKARDYKGGGDSNGDSINYSIMLDATGNIIDNKGFSNTYIYDELDKILTFLRFQSEDEDVMLDYTITKKGLR